MGTCSGSHKCLACGKAITWNFAICSKCEVIYGKSAKAWPEWLRFLWQDEQRIRRQDKRVGLHETSFSDTLSVENIETDYGEDEFTINGSS